MSQADQFIAREGGRDFASLVISSFASAVRLSHALIEYRHMQAQLLAKSDAPVPDTPPADVID